MSAWDELAEYLEKGETIEAIVFGEWGWGHGIGNLGYGEPDPPSVPWELRGKVLTSEEARPLMQSWNFHGGYGAPDCYAANIWTNRRVIWVTQYDGSTSLDSAARNPSATLPNMPGG